jgi:hypothetical protein
MANGNVIGLTLAKVNGIFHLDVKNARWSVKRGVVQHETGSGVRSAVGLEKPSGSFDEVIPRQKGLDWRSLRDFSVEIYDKETQSIVVFSSTGCNWTGLDGSADTSSASATKAVQWVGDSVVKG